MGKGYAWWDRTRSRETGKGRRKGVPRKKTPERDDVEKHTQYTHGCERKIKDSWSCFPREKGRTSLHKLREEEIEAAASSSEIERSFLVALPVPQEARPCFLPSALPSFSWRRRDRAPHGSVCERCVALLSRFASGHPFEGCPSSESSLLLRRKAPGFMRLMPAAGESVRTGSMEMQQLSLSLPSLSPFLSQCVGVCACLSVSFRG